jgi:hypothetical protein
MPYSGSTIAGKILKGIFGDDHTAEFPSTWYVALFAGDPETTGVEPDSTGNYARLAISNANSEFTISGAQVSNDNDWVWPTSTTAYQTGVRILDHWGLMSASSGGTRYLSGRVRKAGVPSSINVDGTNLIPQIDAGSWVWQQAV